MPCISTSPPPTNPEAVLIAQRRKGRSPAAIVIDLPPWHLRNDEHAKANAELAAASDCGNRAVHVGICLPGATRIDDAREPEPAEFAGKARDRCFRSGAGQRGHRALRCKDHRRQWVGREHPGRSTGAVPLDDSAGRILRCRVEAEGLQPHLIHHRAVIEIENVRRTIRHGGIQLGESRHPSLGELKFGPAAADADPLAGRRPRRLA